MSYEVNVGSKTYKKYDTLQEARTVSFQHNLVIAAAIAQYPQFVGRKSYVAKEYD